MSDIDIPETILPCHITKLLKFYWLKKIKI